LSVPDLPPLPYAEFFVAQPHSHSFPDFGVLCDETRFWVIHRRDCYGPFDYQWSTDLYGLELLYQGEKFGECCNSEQFFADLKPYQLPTRVTEVAMTVVGAIIACSFNAISGNERLDHVSKMLQKSGLARYEISLLDRSA
tara:strand:- start:77 stop:496 length:420 start_codon:yes stop_codon:yes gene_type:complete